MKFLLVLFLGSVFISNKLMRLINHEMYKLVNSKSFVNNCMQLYRICESCNYNKNLETLKWYLEYATGSVGYKSVDLGSYMAQKIILKTEVSGHAYKYSCIKQYDSFIRSRISIHELLHNEVNPP